MRREKNRIAAQKSRLRQTQKADSLHLVRTPSTTLLTPSKQHNANRCLSRTCWKQVCHAGFKSITADWLDKLNTPCMSELLIQPISVNNDESIRGVFCYAMPCQLFNLQCNSIAQMERNFEYCNRLQRFLSVRAALWSLWEWICTIFTKCYLTMWRCVMASVGLHTWTLFGVFSEA